jgi:hypothetical protein
MSRPSPLDLEIDKHSLYKLFCTEGVARIRTCMGNSATFPPETSLDDRLRA